jgi:hypothetical protein
MQLTLECNIIPKANFMDICIKSPTISGGPTSSIRYFRADSDRSDSTYALTEMIKEYRLLKDGLGHGRIGLASVE